MKNFKKIIMFFIISLLSTHVCFSKSIYENKIGNLLIEYDDVKLIGSTQYKPTRMLDKNDNTIFIFNKKVGDIVKADECVIIFYDSCILYFYEVSFESIVDWYLYTHGGVVQQKPLICKKVIVEVKR